MNKNIDNYKKALDKIRVSDNLKKKTLNKIINKENFAKTNELKNSTKKDKEKSENINIYGNGKFNPLKMLIYPLTTVLVSFILVFSVIAVDNNIFSKNSKLEQLNNKEQEDVTLALKERDVLPKVQSMDNLNNLLKDLNISVIDRNNFEKEEEKVLVGSETDRVYAINSSNSSSLKEAMVADTADTFLDYSKTNIQVEGIDEADIVKTDGKYIYYIANQKLYMVNVKNPENIIIEETLDYEGQLVPKELYIKDKKVVLILDKSSSNKYYNMNSLICYDVIAYDMETVVITYDIRGEKDLIEGRRIEIEGRYIDSRMIGSEVYFITTKNVYKSIVDNENDENKVIDETGVTDENMVGIEGSNEVNEEIILPKYKDTIKDNEKREVKVEEMLYVPESEETNFLNIVSFSLEKKEEANIKTILGAGQEIYCTDSNLYITHTSYKGEKTGYYTNIYKFKLIDTNIVSTAVGGVNGRPLTQFSMNEYKSQIVKNNNEDDIEVISNFSIVTTNEIWKTSNSITTKNDLYIFDENLKQVGVLEDIGKNETLKSVRFMGNKAYVVTFKKTDPLFVIDISNAENPTILGELKIPGYSTYLHPYDENHLIGIGQDVEIQETYYGEREIQKGVKVSLFDISDYSNPKELYSIVLDEKSYTNIQYDHKSVLFAKDKDLLAFPITSYEDKETKNQYVVLSINLDEGISIREKIEHGYTEMPYGYKYMINIDRGLYINNNLYTLSGKKIEVRALTTLERISEVVLF